VYSISILYFKEFHNEKEYIYHGKTEFRGLHNGKILPLTATQKKQFHVETSGDLYPEYYLLDVTNFNDVAKNTLDEWIYYFKNSEIREDFTAKGMREVKNHLDYEKLSSVEKRSYEKAIDIKLGWESAIDSAKLEGLFEGRAEGEAKGRAEGEAKGRAEGKTEIALNMFKKGVSIEDVAELTGLSLDYLRAL
jgi:predicted transposase/invertase (TIGR01784 family)